MRVHFFSGTAAINDAAYDGCTGLRPDVELRRFALTDAPSRDAYEREAPEADVTISFLNPFVFRDEHLERAGRSYNIHPSTPLHPGQDPQHWTIYQGTFMAGATLHLIERQVDAGPILDVAEIHVPPDTAPPEINRQSENMALALLFGRLDDILAGSLQPIDRQWAGENRRKRSDFVSMCQITPDIDPSELDRRIRSFHVPTYRNRLQTTIHGQRFVYAGTPDDDR